MSSFTKPLIVEVLNDGKHYRLAEEFEYYRTGNPDAKILIPKGFITDFATIPRIFQAIMPPTGTRKNSYGKAAVLHDYLYDKDCLYIFTRQEADLIFLEAMQARGVNRFVSWILYTCAKYFAKHRFRQESRYKGD